jgi:hypothetical protein
MVRCVSRFRLQAHTLQVDRNIWSRGDESTICDKCSLHEDQDEARVLLKCMCPEVCRLRRTFSVMFQQVPGYSQTAHCVPHVTTRTAFAFLSQKKIQALQFYF